MEIISLVSIIWVMFCVVGYIAHKLYPKVYPTWTSAMKGAIQGIANIFYEELTGKSPIAQIENTILKLTAFEREELRKYLEGHPYDMLRLTSYDIKNSICFFDFDATGLASRYAEISTEEIAKMCAFRVQTFFKEKRQISYLVYIDPLVATPTRLCFAIPLSENGIRFLEQQHQTEIAATSQSEKHPPQRLEEEIDLNQNE